MSGGTDLSAAYLLHYTAHRDSSFIADFFTLNSGLVTLYARGARSGKNRPLYQPFRPLFVSWTGDRELKTLTGIEASGTPIDFNDTAMACAYYFNELMLRLLPKFVSQPELFGHYLLALQGLEEGEGDSTEARLASLEPCLRLFELALLDAIGVAPDFGACANDGQTPVAASRYRFYPSLGRAAELFSDQPDCDPYEIHREGLIRNDAGVEVSGRSLLALAAVDLETIEDDNPDNANEKSASVLPDVKRIMRPLIRIQLGDRPLKSRKYFESLRRG